MLSVLHLVLQSVHSVLGLVPNFSASFGTDFRTKFGAPFGVPSAPDQSASVQARTAGVSQVPVPSFVSGYGGTNRGDSGVMTRAKARQVKTLCHDSVSRLCVRYCQDFVF